MVAQVARAAIALAVAILWSSAAASPAWTAEPIKIGLVHPFTGPLSPVGIEATDGFEQYFDEHGKTVAGAARLSAVSRT